MANWLGQQLREDWLWLYQNDDCAIGIWTSALRPTLRDDKRMLIAAKETCDSETAKNTPIIVLNHYVKKQDDFKSMEANWKACRKSCGC
jgi:hypothetical protein